MAWSREQPFQALALTGGGYRGLFTARALQAIEEHTGKRVGKLFDLTCGTSIGGIVALAVAFEVPMNKVVDTFVSLGTTIFPPRIRPTSQTGKLYDLYKHRSQPRYSTTHLRTAITQLIPEKTLLGEAVHPVAIPAVNVTQGRPQVFKTRHKAEWVRDSKFKVVDVALATSAAPTFFELAEVDGSFYADGGLFANAPDLIATHEAEHFFEVSPEAIRLLSIGTTTKSYSLSMKAGRHFGVADWMEEERLFSVIISAQQQLVDSLMKHKLGEHYLRLDHEPSQEQARDLGLDLANSTAANTLMALAKKATTDILGTTLAPFLAHTPQLSIVKGG